MTDTNQIARRLITGQSDGAYRFSPLVRERKTETPDPTAEPGLIRRAFAFVTKATQLPLLFGKTVKKPGSRGGRYRVTPKGQVRYDAPPTGHTRAELDKTTEGMAAAPPVPAVIESQPEIFVQIGNRRYQVGSFQEASQKFAKARDMIFNSGGGSAQIPRALIVDGAGNLIGHISQNGRVWEGSPGSMFRDGKYVGGKLLYDNQRRPDESAIPARKQGDVLHTFVDEDSNMESRVVVGDRGFNVVLLDLDSGQFVPQARIYPFDLENAEQRAVDAAKTVLRPIAKAHVKQYTRASRSGAPVTVKEHDDKRPNARLKLKGFRRPGQQQPPAHRLATLHSAGPDSPGRTFRIQPGDKPGAWNIHPDDQRTVAGGLKEQAAPPKPVGPAPSGSAEAVIARPSTAYKPVNDAGRDTEERFKNSDGSWTVERQQLHNAILAKLAEPAAPPSQTPVFFMTGGGPAAGKGNILKSGSLQLPQNHMSIDADEIKKLLPEYRELVAKKDVKASVFAHEESSYLSTAAISHAAKNKFHAVYDSVGDSGLEKLAGKIKLMRAGGHKVVAHYVTCSTDAAISRARARGEKTGRFVPDAVIRGGHAAVSRILPELMKSGLLDECSLWDTEAGKPRLVASSKAKKVTVHDKTLWKQFLDKSNDDEQRQPAAA